MIPEVHNYQLDSEDAAGYKTMICSSCGRTIQLRVTPFHKIILVPGNIHARHNFVEGWQEMPVRKALSMPENLQKLLTKEGFGDLL